MLKKILCCVMLLLFFAVPAMAASVTLAWDPNSETDLAGYRIYRSTTAGGPYTQIEKNVSVSEAPRFTDDTVPDEDGTWYYVVTAFDENGNESGYSNEVFKRFDTTPPANPGNLLIEAVDLAIKSLEKFREYVSAVTDTGTLKLQ